MKTWRSDSRPSSSPSSTTSHSAASGDPVTPGRPVRAHAPAASRPRPTTKRPGRAALDPHEPCPARPGGAARRGGQARPGGKPPSGKKAGPRGEPPSAHPKPSGAEDSVRRAAPAAQRKKPAGGTKARATRKKHGGKRTGAAAASAEAKRLHPKKRVRLDEAFRARGLDEHEVADKYVVALRKLSRKKRQEGEGGVEKLLLDTLKECSRILEPPRPASERASSDAPAVVKLIHRVPRPSRPGRRADAEGGATGGEP